MAGVDVGTEARVSELAVPELRGCICVPVRICAVCGRRGGRQVFTCVRVGPSV